jgi:hypothetical protein
MAEVPAIIDAFEKMLTLDVELKGDDCHYWYKALYEKVFTPVLDYNCQIFKVSDDSCTMDFDNRLFCISTRTNPCILHLSGGYTDQNTGKDDRMVPWAKRIGILP